MEKFLELIEKADDNNPIKIAYKNNHRYYDDFVTVIKTFKQALTNKQFKELIDKFQLTKPFDQQRYLQTTSEITILYYILRYYNNSFKYEPKYNGGSNPECSFTYMHKTVNLEVKCPDLKNRIISENRNSLKLFAAERLPNHTEVINEISDIIKANLQNSEYSGVEETKRLDNKLKDYLVSSKKKFPVSDDSNFNILAISLDIISDLDEWYSYIFGDNGVFTNNSFVGEKYDNVDAILLTTPAAGHIRWDVFDKINVWNLEETVNLILLNPDREHSVTGEYYFQNIFQMFGSFTEDFFEFQIKLTKLEDEKWKYMKKSEILRNLRYLEFKDNDLQIITKFTDYLQNGHL